MSESENIIHVSKIKATFSIIKGSNFIKDKHHFNEIFTFKHKLMDF